MKTLRSMLAFGILLLFVGTIAQLGAERLATNTFPMGDGKTLSQVDENKMREIEHTSEGIFMLGLILVAVAVMRTTRPRETNPTELS
jgi:hypothetical protein